MKLSRRKRMHGGGAPTQAQIDRAAVYRDDLPRGVRQREQLIRVWRTLAFEEQESAKSGMKALKSQQRVPRTRVDVCRLLELRRL